MKLTRQNFIDYVFQPYNAAVKRGEYNKIGYEDWRKLRGWAYDETWSTHDMEIKEQCGDYLVGLWHNLRVCPVPFYFSADDGAFGSWIRDHRMEVILWDKDVRAIIDQPVMSYDINDCSTNYAKLDPSNLIVGYGCDSAAEHSVHFSTDKVYFDGQTLQEKIDECIEKANKEKENNKMKFGNFDFGPVDSSVRMSLYGMAIKNASGAYVAYDANSKQVMDVDILNFEGANKFIYKMPAAIKDIHVGDVVIHARKPMFVQSVKGENRLNVLDIYDGEEKTIVLAKSPFGFDFVTKVVSLINMVGSADSANPFGNMLPFLMMSEGKGMDDMLPFLLMSQGGNGFASNPMLMYAMMSKDGKMNDMLPFLLMGSCVSPAPAAGCNGTCTGHCEGKK